MSTAEGLVQNLVYTSSYPMLVNVGGESTYFMTLKDSSGLVRRYALVNVAQYTKTVQSESLSDFVSLYHKELGKSAIRDTSEIMNASGMVTKCQEAVCEGSTHYFFMLENNEMLFKASVMVSDYLPLKMKSGVDVTISYYIENEIGVVTNVSF